MPDPFQSEDFEAEAVQLEAVRGHGGDDRGALAGGLQPAHRPQPDDRLSSQVHARLLVQLHALLVC
nr:hypothetical protein OH837_32685 [Streptomyces canus]